MWHFMSVIVVLSIQKIPNSNFVGLYSSLLIFYSHSPTRYQISFSPEFTAAIKISKSLARKSHLLCWLNHSLCFHQVNASSYIRLFPRVFLWNLTTFVISVTVYHAVFYQLLITEYLHRAVNKFISRTAKFVVSFVYTYEHFLKPLSLSDGIHHYRP